MKVKEVIAFLQQFPADAEVFSCGPDCGGYDAEFGRVTTMATFGKVFSAEFDMTMVEFGSVAEGWIEEHSESPCIYHSGSH